MTRRVMAVERDTDGAEHADGDPGGLGRIHDPDDLRLEGRAVDDERGLVPRQRHGRDRTGADHPARIGRTRRRAATYRCRP